jgi:hypothetical protein
MPTIPCIRLAHLIDLKRGYTHPWTDAFAEELKQETGFQAFGEVPAAISAKEEEAIAAGEPCPRCNGDGYEMILSGGEVTPILAWYRHKCPCDPIVRFYQRWNDPTVVEERFRDARLSTLKPVDGLFISKAHQKLTIAAVKAHPTHSFFMHGDAEKGKTHLMTALFRAALENEIVQQGVLKNRGTCVFRVFTEQLLSELKEWFAPRKDNEPAPPVPTVTV